MAVFALLGPLGLASGCLVTTDPTVPCSARDVGSAEVGTVVSASDAPVLAVAGDAPYLLQWKCDGCELDEKPLVRDVDPADDVPPEPLSPGSAILLTSAGGYVVAIDAEDGAVLSWKVTADLGSATPHFPSPKAPKQLVASLRGSDRVIVRDAGGGLAVWDPSKATGIDPIDGDHPNLLAVAIGDEHIVAREIHGDGEDILYLVEASGEFTAGPVPLLRAGPFTAVSIAPGDTHVVATAGEGSDAETFVFEVPSGELVDRFIGKQIPGRADLEVLPGMRSVSPDGSVLAYRTAAGSLALREIEAQSSCLLRSATSGVHTIAGFAADGTLYFESAIDTGETRVLAFDLLERYVSPLGPVDESWRLAAVPAQPGDASPWAVAVREGMYAALQDGAKPERLGLSNVAFLPRDDAAVWALDSDIDYSSGAPRRTLSARRIEPVAIDERSWSFDDDDGAQEQMHYDELTTTQRVCVSSGAPGSWAYQCGETGGSKFFAGTPPLPDSEDPSSDGPGPEVPDDDDPTPASCDPKGWARYDASHESCPVLAGSCCFATGDDACEYLGCYGSQCGVTDLEDGKQDTASCLGSN